MILSIIVPVYKVEEEYLRACLDSLRELKSENIEIILIDDGSPDDSGKICDEYSSKDDRFRTIHKINEGVSIARNNGILAARGKYVVFVDADDWIESDKFDMIIGELENCECDVLALGQYIDFKGKESKEVRPFEGDKLFDSKGEMRELCKMVLVRGYKTLTASDSSGVFCNAVVKFIKKEVLIERELQFEIDIAISEDSIFYLKLYQYCDYVKYRDVCLYHYRMRGTSACRKSLDGCYDNIRKFYGRIVSILEKFDIKIELELPLYYRCYELILEQFIPIYVMSDRGFWDGMLQFSKEVKSEPFKEIIRFIKLENIAGTKNKIKLLCLKMHLPMLFYVLQKGWIALRGNNVSDEYY